ncbi:MAG TPA: hypothetical protein V6D05_06250 [Stenomitos sp.]
MRSSGLEGRGYAVLDVLVWRGLPILLLALVISLVKPAHANPIFARQTGFSCNTCHFQHVPKLNAFGRRFKAGGYSLTTQPVIDGEGLSLPPTLNAALKLSAQYTDERTLPQDLPGKIEFPPHHGAALLVGGRLAEGVGGFVEYDGALGTGKVAFTHAAPWGIGTAGVAPFVTDMSGPMTGFELLNTGVYDMDKPFGRAASPVTGANSNLNLATHATGMSLYLANDQWNVAYTPFAATDAGQTTGLNLSQYARAAFTPNLFGWDLGLGAGYVWGATSIASTSTTPSMPGMPGMAMYRIQHADEAPAQAAATIRTRAWFVDAQAQGRLFDHDLGLYAVYGVGDEHGTENLYGGIDVRPVGWGVNAEYSLWPRLGLLATYGQYDNGDPYDNGYDQTGVGLSFALTQNILLEPMYEVFTGDSRPVDNRFTFRMLTVF